mgnify:CR=1 FL=1
MCIRDSSITAGSIAVVDPMRGDDGQQAITRITPEVPFPDCLLYTSDAADERSSVDLGGRRIIKKKNKRHRARVAYITTRVDICS